MVHQDAHVFVSRLNERRSVSHDLPPGRGAYLYVIEGDIDLNGTPMSTGAAAQVREEPAIEISARRASELILVDVTLS